jgi:hypothetical protein
MQIDGLKDYQRRGSPGNFADLPPEQQKRAHYWLTRWLTKYRCQGRQVPKWKFAILCGQARRLAKNPATSAWGRSMCAKKGGYAVQERYRAEGRHPTERATAVRVLRQQGPPIAACDVRRGNFSGPPEPVMAEIRRVGLRQD